MGCARSILFAVVQIALGSLAVIPDSESANLQAIRYYDIPSQSVRSALIEFSEQAAVQVMGPSDDYDNLRSVEVKGSMSGSEALRTLLVDTGLQFRLLPKAIIVRPKPKAGDAPGPTDEGLLSEEDILESVRNIVVTGTRIHADEPIGESPLEIDRDAIAKTGYSTVHDVLRSMTQVFGGGPSDDSVLGEANTASGTGINLRALGAGATLVLVNGRRLAPSGLDGSFTDISSVPLAAVSRIDVLPDGASAIYGSDAVGGVVNLIMRDHFEGSETQASIGSVTKGPLQETNASQLWGHRWSTGRVMLAYEFLHRDALPAQYREFTADSDLRRFGGDDFSLPQSNPGTVTIGGRTYAVPENQDGRDLSPNSFVPGTINLQNSNEGRDAISEQRRHSVYVSMSQQFGSALSLSADSLYSRRTVDFLNLGVYQNLTVPVSNPFRVVPAGADPSARYNVGYNFGPDLGERTYHVDVKTFTGSISTSTQLPRQWAITTVASYGSEEVNQVQGNQVNQRALSTALADPDRRTAFNPFADGSSTNPETLDHIRASTFFASDSEVAAATLTAQGSVLSLSTGPVKLAAGIDYRKQRFQSRQRSASENAVSENPEFSRSVAAAFAELSVPVISEVNQLPGVEQVTLSVAGRYDDYDDFGSAFSPRIGLEWSPWKNVFIHSAWGQSFKAPSLTQLDERANISYIFSTPDLNSTSGTASVLFWEGGNADLTAETARTWSIGVRWSAEGRLHPTVDLTHFDVLFRDRIAAAPRLDSVLADPARYSYILHGAYTSSERESICDRSNFIGNFGQTVGDCLSAPIEAIVDYRYQNLMISKTKGFDLTASINVVAGKWGSIEATTGLTYLLDFSEGGSALLPAVSVLDTVNNPLRLRMHEGISWRRNEFGLAAFVTYAGAYQDTQSVPKRHVHSWTTVDLHFSYEPVSQDWLAGCSLALTLRNVVDKSPPFVNSNSGVGYDRENADPFGRFVTLRATKRW